MIRVAAILCVFPFTTLAMSALPHLFERNMGVPAPQIRWCELKAEKATHLASEPERWRTGNPLDSKVEYRGVYPRIDPVFSGSDRQIECDSSLAPGARAGRIRFAFDGMQQIRNEDGDYVADSTSGKQRHRKPPLYQWSNSNKVEIAGRFLLPGPRQAGFVAEDYDAKETLMMKSALYGSYPEAPGDEQALADAVNALPWPFSLSSSTGNADTGTHDVAGRGFLSDLPTNSRTYQSGLSAGWQRVGSWTVASAAPQIVSLTPSSGSGLSQTFSIAVSDPNSASSLGLYVLVNSQLSSVNACEVVFDRASNLVWLIADNGTTWLTAGTVGSGSLTSNSQCSVDPAGSSLSQSGNVVTVNLRIVFNPAFSSAKRIFLTAAGQSGVNTGWQQLGSWTVASSAPHIVSLSPSSGSGVSQTFSIAVSDPNSANSLGLYVLVNSQLSSVNACQVVFDRASNLVWLIADNETTWLTAGTVGSGSLTSNSQCSVDPAGSSLSQSGNVLTLNLRFVFKPAFSGAKQIFVMASGQSGLNTGWQQLGSWTVASAAPQIVSLSPSSGSGVSQTFSIAVSDPNSATNLGMYVLVNSQSSSVNACQIVFDRASNLVWLIGDDGTTWLTAGVVGSGSLTSNAQCSVDPAGSSLSQAGSVLTLNLRFIFKPAFSGVKHVFLLATGLSGLTTGWQQVGSWTVASAPPQILSLTPSSGSGLSQTFSIAVTDPNSATSLGMYVLVNSQSSSVNACQIVFDRASNLLWLIADNGTAWLTAGTVGSGSLTSNSQCSLDPVGSSLAQSGNVLTLNLRLVFKPAWSGARKVFLLAVGQSGLNTGWQQFGSWTN